jgi:hypothetical protein
MTATLTDELADQIKQVIDNGNCTG